MRGDQLNTWSYSFSVVTILTSDLLLPIPSSAVMTHAGAKLGILGGTLVGWLGVTSGSVLGFLLARFLGGRFLEPRLSESECHLLAERTERYGVFIVVLLRPVPIFAEASVLLLAVGRMSFWRFCFWLALSNLFLALFFSAFGQWAEASEIGEIPSILISLAIPILLLFTTRFFFQSRLIRQKHELAEK